MAASKSPTVLSGAAIRHLRGLGHDLKPVVMIGKEGVTESLAEAARAALLRHELIKVKVQSEAPVDRHDAAKSLADATDSTLAQVLGRTFLLYKRHPKKPKIVLPKPGAAGKGKAAPAKADKGLTKKEVATRNERARKEDSDD